MTPSEISNISVIREYLAALERGDIGDDLARFFTVDAVQEELPNALNPRGQSSDLPTILERAARGRDILVAQHYLIRSILARDSSVAVEAEWVGSLAIQFGALAAGSQMKAHFAMFFELFEGKIRIQRNYDCFEPL